MRGIIELLFVIGAPLIQQILSTLRINDKIKLPIDVITIVCVFLGFILPVLATIIFMQELSDKGVKCLTGAEGMAVIGFMINIVFSPIIAVRSFRKYRLKHPLRGVGYRHNI